MRGLSLLDVLIMGAVLAVLLVAARHEFAQYDTRTLSPPPTAASPSAG